MFNECDTYLQLTETVPGSTLSHYLEKNGNVFRIAIYVLHPCPRFHFLGNEFLKKLDRRESRLLHYRVQKTLLKEKLPVVNSISCTSTVKECTAFLYCVVSM